MINMRIKKMFIDNLFSFKEDVILTFEDEQHPDGMPLVFFVGPNNSGKSNVLRILRLFSNLLDERGVENRNVWHDDQLWNDLAHLQRKAGDSSLVMIKCALSSNEFFVLWRYLLLYREAMMKEIEVYFRKIRQNLLKASQGEDTSSRTEMLERSLKSFKSLWESFFDKLKEGLKEDVWFVLSYRRKPPQPYLVIEFDVTLTLDDGTQYIVRWINPRYVVAHVQVQCLGRGDDLDAKFASFLKKRNEKDLKEMNFIPVERLLREFEEEIKRKSSDKNNANSRVDTHQVITLPKILDFWERSESCLEHPKRTFSRIEFNELRHDMLTRGINLPKDELFLQYGDKMERFSILAWWLLKQRLFFFDSSSLTFFHNFATLLERMDASWSSKVDGTPLDRALFHLSVSSKPDERARYQAIKEKFTEFFRGFDFDVVFSKKQPKGGSSSKESGNDDDTGNLQASIYLNLRHAGTNGKTRRFKQVPLTQAAAGMAQVLGLLLIILGVPDDAITCLDEPTSNLHASLQAQLRQFLKEEMIGKKRTQLFIVTHSPSLIRIPQLASFLQHFRLDEVSKSTMVTSLGELFKKSNIKVGGDITFRHNATQVLFARTVLLVEGSDDIDTLFYLDEIVPESYKLNLEQAELLVIPINGKKNVFKYITLCEKLGITCLTILDGDAIISPRKNKCQKKEPSHRVDQFIKMAANRGLVESKVIRQLESFNGTTQEPDYFTNPTITEIRDQLKERNIFVLDARNLERALKLPPNAKGWKDIGPRLEELKKELSNDKNILEKNYPELVELLEWLKKKLST